MGLENETLRMRHQTKDPSGIILQGSDLMGAAVDVTGVKQGGTAVFNIVTGSIGNTDKATFGMCDRQLKLVRQTLKIGTVRILLQPGPATDEPPAGVMNQTAFGQEMELRENLKA